MSTFAPTESGTPEMRPVGEASSEASTGLLSDAELIATLRAALGPAVGDAELGRAVASIRDSEAAKWEQLPPEIDPDMGYNYEFLSCSETCWLGRKVLLEGATFRVFRQKDQ